MSSSKINVATNPSLSVIVEDCDIDNGGGNGIVKSPCDNENVFIEFEHGVTPINHLINMNLGEGYIAITFQLMEQLEKLEL